MSRNHIKRRVGRRSEITDAEVKSILMQAIVDAGATAPAIYAYHKTEVILTSDNDAMIAPERLRAWNAAVNEYRQLVARSKQ
jgi:hypothetical protein